MRTFHRLILDSSRDDLFSVVKYEVEGFDLTVFRKGKKIEKPVMSLIK